MQFVYMWCFYLITTDTCSLWWEILVNPRFRLVVVIFDTSGFNHFKCMLAFTLFVTYVICDMFPLF